MPHLIFYAYNMANPRARRIVRTMALLTIILATAAMAFACTAAHASSGTAISTNQPQSHTQQAQAAINPVAKKRAVSTSSEPIK